VIRLTFTPRADPLIPTGSRMPSWLSTTNSRGRLRGGIWRFGVDRDGPRPLETRSDVGAGDLCRRRSPATPSEERPRNVAAATPA